jgi:hypothetical protein
VTLLGCPSIDDHHLVSKASRSRWIKRAHNTYYHRVHPCRRQCAMPLRPLAHVAKPPRAASGQAERASTFASPCCTLRTCSFMYSAAGGPLPLVQLPPGHPHTWPGCHESWLAELWLPTGVREPHSMATGMASICRKS